jgi:hypothetical protein
LLPTALDRDWRKQDVPHHATILGDQRQRLRTGLSQAVDKSSFHGLSKRQLVDLANVRSVLRSLVADGNHGAQYASREIFPPSDSLNADGPLERPARCVDIVVKLAGLRGHQIACLTIIPGLNRANLIDLRTLTVTRVRV